jgi:hypothetical protein
MAITANTFSLVTLPTDGVLFYKSLQSEDVTGTEEIAAAVTGATHYITKLSVYADAAMDVSIGSGKTGAAVTTVHFGPVPLDANHGIIFWEAPPGMGLKCTAATAIDIDATGAGTVWIEVHGKTCKNDIT